jgi:hypothetical protein
MLCKALESLLSPANHPFLLCSHRQRALCSPRCPQLGSPCPHVRGNSLHCSSTALSSTGSMKLKALGLSNRDCICGSAQKLHYRQSAHCSSAVAHATLHELGGYCAATISDVGFPRQHSCGARSSVAYSRSVVWAALCMAVGCRSHFLLPHFSLAAILQKSCCFTNCRSRISLFIAVTTSCQPPRAATMSLLAASFPCQRISLQYCSRRSWALLGRCSFSSYSDCFDIACSSHTADVVCA